MITWRTRVKITTLAAAAAAAVTTWIVYAPARERLVVVDEAELAEAIMERAAALSYATNVTTIVGWTTLKWVTNAPPAVWGGYSNVVIDIPSGAGAGDALDGTYHFAARSVVDYEGFASDRGFIDVYTNGPRALLDLGPAGGSLLGVSSGGGIWGPIQGVRVGGWAIADQDGSAYPDLALPRGFHLSSAWFMARSGAPELVAFGYDPADCTATPGGLDPSRVTYWNPGHWATTTNHAAQRPFRQDRWYADTGGGVIAWDVEDYRHPRVIWPSVCPFLDGYLADHIGSLLSPLSYIDYSQATLGLTDFDGWESEDFPYIGENAVFARCASNWLAYVSSAQTAILTRPAITNLGLALMELQSLEVDAIWTNLVSGIYYSREFRNTAEEWDGIRADPGWYIPVGVATNLPARPCYALYTLVWSPEGESPCQLAYEFTQAAPAAYLGAAHNNSGWDEATAHYWSEGYNLPVGETVLRPRTNEYVRLATETGLPGGILHVFDVRVPSLVGPPPGSYFPSYADFNGPWSYSGYEIGFPQVIAAPIWQVGRMD